jgi:exosortase D (VPLPA-CTERM-specific)
MAVSLDASPRLRRSCGVSGWIAAAITALAAAILYIPVLSGLFSQWATDDDAAYGLIVAGAAALLFIQRRSRLAGVPLRGSRAGGLLLACASALYVVGTLAADVFLVRLSLPVFIVGSIWFMAGVAHLRALAAPLALCFVAIPLPSALVTEITMPLQLMASQCAAAILSLVGVPVVRDGNVLTLKYITLEVAQACSGMRSLVTLSALVAVYASMRELPLRRVALLAMATVPVALLGNGLRVAVTALLASRLGADAARGPVHDLTGWIAFILMAFAIFRSESILNRFRVRSECVQSEVMGRLKVAGRTDRSFSTRLGAVAALIVALAAWTHARPIAWPATSPAVASVIPLAFGDWAGREAPPLDPEVARILAADEYVHRFYGLRSTKFEQRVEMDVAYYAKPQAGAAMHSPLNCLPGNGWQVIETRRTPIHAGAATWDVRRLVVDRKGYRIAMAYWFQNRGAVVGNEFHQRFRLLTNGLQGRPTDAALVRVMALDTPAGHRTIDAFTRELIPTLARALGVRAN